VNYGNYQEEQDDCELEDKDEAGMDLEANKITIKP
jgi:hypothetical protein